jgi:hypothetical protein
MSKLIGWPDCAAACLDFNKMLGVFVSNLHLQRIYNVFIDPTIILPVAFLVLQASFVFVCSLPSSSEEFR